MALMGLYSNSLADIFAKLFLRYATLRNIPLLNFQSNSKRMFSDLELDNLRGGVFCYALVICNHGPTGHGNSGDIDFSLLLI